MYVYYSFALKTVFFCYKSQVTQNITFKPSYDHFCHSTELPIKFEANRSRGDRTFKQTGKQKLSSSLKYF